MDKLNNKWKVSEMVSYFVNGFIVCFCAYGVFLSVALAPVVGSLLRGWFFFFDLSNLGGSASLALLWLNNSR